MTTHSPAPGHLLTNTPEGCILGGPVGGNIKQHRRCFHDLKTCYRKLCSMATALASTHCLRAIDYVHSVASVEAGIQEGAQGPLPGFEEEEE